MQDKIASKLSDFINRSSSKNVAEITQLLTNSPPVSSLSKPADMHEFIYIKQIDIVDSVYKVVPRLEFFRLADLIRQEGIAMHYVEPQNPELLVPQMQNIETDIKKDNPSSGVMLDFDYSSNDSRFMFGSPTFRDICQKLKLILARIMNYKMEKLYILILGRSESVKYDGDTQYTSGFHVLIPQLRLRQEEKIFLIEQLQASLTPLLQNVLTTSEISALIDPMSSEVPVFILGSCKLKKVGGCYVPYKMLYCYLCDEYGVCPIKDNELANYEKNMCSWLSISSERKVDEKTGDYWLPPMYLEIAPDYVDAVAAIKKSLEEDFSQKNKPIDTNNPDALFLRGLLNLFDEDYTSCGRRWWKIICSIANWNADFAPIAEEFSARCKTKYAISFAKTWRILTRVGAKFQLGKNYIKNEAQKANKAAYDVLMVANLQEWLLTKALENDGILQENAVAELLYRLYADTFKFTNDGRPTWYSFVKPDFLKCDIGNVNYREVELYKWNKVADSIELKKIIMTTLQKYFKCVLDDLVIRCKLEQASSSASSNRKTKNPATSFLNLIKANFQKTCGKLDSVNYISSIVRAAETNFRDANFEIELDKKSYLLGVANGVLEFDNGENDMLKNAPTIGAESIVNESIKDESIVNVVSPPGISGQTLAAAPTPTGAARLHTLHQFPVSKYTTTTYVDMPMKDFACQKIFTILRDIFVEPDTLEYMLYHAATGLDMRIAHGILTLLIGGGANGKSWYLNAVRNTLGDSAAVSVPFALFQTNTGSGAGAGAGAGANSAAMSLKGARWVYVDEGKEVALEDYSIKTLCSPNPSFSCRELFKTQERFPITANIVISSNFECILLSTDYGTCRRIVYYRCKSKFVESPAEGSPYEKKMNKDYETIMDKPEMRSAMLAILCYYYKNLFSLYKGHLKNVVAKCETLVKESAAYIGRQNTLGRFLNEYLIKVESTAKLTAKSDIEADIEADVKDLTADVISDAYLKWYARYESKTIIPSLKKTIAEISDNCGLPFVFNVHSGARTLSGYKLRELL